MTMTQPAVPVRACPLDDPPRGVLPRDAAGHIVPGANLDALRTALRGVQLGAYDERLIAHLGRLFDEEMAVGLCSLIERARVAGARSNPKGGRSPLADLPTRKASE